MFRYVPVFSLILTFPLLADIDVRTNIRDVDVNGINHEAGAITLSVNGNDLPTASPTTPVYLRIGLESNVRLGETLVDFSGIDSSGNAHQNRPIFLAVRREGSEGLIVLPPDAISLVRFIKGESEIWLKVTQPTSEWFEVDGTASSPTPSMRAALTIGVTARNSWNRNQGDYFLGAANLPANTRYPSMITDPAHMATTEGWAQSSTISIDTVNSQLEPWPSIHAEADIDYRAFASDTIGVTTVESDSQIVIGTSLPVTIRGDDTIARAIEVSDCASALISSNRPVEIRPIQWALGVQQVTLFVEDSFEHQCQYPESRSFSTQLQADTGTSFLVGFISDAPDPVIYDGEWVRSVETVGYISQPSFAFAKTQETYEENGVLLSQFIYIDDLASSPSTVSHTLSVPLVLTDVTKNHATMVHTSLWSFTDSQFDSYPFDGTADDGDPSTGVTAWDQKKRLASRFHAGDFDIDLPLAPHPKSLFSPLKKTIAVPANLNPEDVELIMQTAALTFPHSVDLTITASNNVTASVDFLVNQSQLRFPLSELPWRFASGDWSDLIDQAFQLTASLKNGRPFAMSIRSTLLHDFHLMGIDRQTPLLPLQRFSFKETLLPSDSITVSNRSDAAQSYRLEIQQPGGATWSAGPFPIPANTAESMAIDVLPWTPMSLGGSFRDGPFTLVLISDSWDLHGVATAASFSAGSISSFDPGNAFVYSSSLLPPVYLNPNSSELTFMTSQAPQNPIRARYLDLAGSRWFGDLTISTLSTFTFKHGLNGVGLYDELDGFTPLFPDYAPVLLGSEPGSFYVEYLPGITLIQSTTTTTGFSVAVGDPIADRTRRTFAYNNPVSSNTQSLTAVNTSNQFVPVSIMVRDDDGDSVAYRSTVPAMTVKQWSLEPGGLDPLLPAERIAIGNGTILDSIGIIEVTTAAQGDVQIRMVELEESGAIEWTTTSNENRLLEFANQPVQGDPVINILSADPFLDYSVAVINSVLRVPEIYQGTTDENGQGSMNLVSPLTSGLTVDIYAGHQSTTIGVAPAASVELGVFTVDLGPDLSVRTPTPTTLIPRFGGCGPCTDVVSTWYVNGIYAGNSATLVLDPDTSTYVELWVWDKSSATVATDHWSMRFEEAVTTLSIYWPDWPQPRNVRNLVDLLNQWVVGP